MLENRLNRNVDWLFVGLTYMLAAFGVVMIISATRGDVSLYHKKQIINIIMGSAALAVFLLLDYHHLARLAKQIYALNIGMLLLVFLPIFRHASNGAGRWIRIGGFLFQPSEFAKLFTIITLAVFLADRRETIKEPGTVYASLFYIGIPAVLILKQPDLGTSLVIFAIWFAMLFIAGARMKQLLGLVAAGALLAIVLWNSGVMKDYQKLRIRTWMSQDSDKGDAGYHVHQARIAIGSGGMWGKGLFHSTQVRGGFIPEKQTDFIFTSIGEELGFVGAITLITIYAFWLFRGIMIIASSDEDYLGKLMSTGIVAMFGFHIIINVGMNIGMVPVVGVPLILISYGGSSMITTLAAVGLLQSISRYRHQLLF